MSTLVLKNPKGWFAAGAEVEKALTLLSDGAFKLFVYLCLNARRDTGVLNTTQTELARQLKKGTAAIRTYLREMEVSGVCCSHFSRSPASRGRLEVAEVYWPYRKVEAENPDDGAEGFVAAIKKLLQAQPCVQATFSTADEILARRWFQQNRSLEQIEHAILLGCSRKYASWRNHHHHGPILTLRYFEPLLEEVQQTKVASDYWNYLRFRLQRLEKLWKESHPANPSTVEAIAAPPDNDGPPSKTSQPRRPNIGEVRLSDSQLKKGDDDD